MLVHRVTVVWSADNVKRITRHTANTNWTLTELSGQKRESSVRVVTPNMSEHMNTGKNILASILNRWGIASILFELLGT